MSLLERTDRPDTDDPQPRDWRSLGVAAGYGSIGALALGLLILVVALAAWVADPRSSVDWLDNLSFAAAAWGLVHRGSLSVHHDGVGHVVLAPLLLTAFAVWLARRSARSLTAYLGRGERTRRPWWEPPAAFVIGYAVTGTALTLLPLGAAMRTNPLAVIPGAIVVGAVGVLWATWRDEAGGEEAGRGAAGPDDGPVRAAMTRAGDRTPVTLLRAVRPAVEGVLGFAALGTLLVLLLVAFHLGRVEALHGQLGAGIAGTIVLALAQLVLLPNLALYAGSWLTGASLQLGPVTVSAMAVHAGVLPMVPVLGAVPQAGALPRFVGVAPALVVLVGAGIGWRAAARHTTLSPLRAKVTSAATSAALATAALLVLMWWASASVSPGALHHIGPTLLVVPLLAAELVGGACASAAAAHWHRTRR